MSGKLRIEEGLGNTGLGVDRNRPGEKQRGKGGAAESPQKAQHLRQTEADHQAESERSVSRGTLQALTGADNAVPQQVKTVGTGGGRSGHRTSITEAGREAPGVLGPGWVGLCQTQHLESPASDFPAVTSNREGLCSPVCRESHSS